MANRPEFFTYIITNADRTVLYVGMTNNLSIRMVGHWISTDSFVSRYKVYYLLWFERSPYVLNAIKLEKQLKSCSREQKDEIITSDNPDWRFLNEEILGVWPPTEAMINEVRERYSRDPQRRWR